MLTMWQTLSMLSTSVTHASRRQPSTSCSKCHSSRQACSKVLSSCNNPEMQNHGGSRNCNMLPTTGPPCGSCCHNATGWIHGKRQRRGQKQKLQHQQPMWQWLLLFTLLLGIFSDAAEATLRNVNLLIEPPAVRRGQSVALRCDYQLDGAPLYSIKFYRGQMEFYRYTPGEYPHTKVFQYPGIRVDDSSSNATLVLIRNVGFGLSGNFSCEVTADAPLYSTATAYAQMQVVEFPEKRPQLFTEHTRYEPGDVLRANCSTPPSRPRAELRFTINNVPVTTDETQYIRTVDNLIASRLSLKLQLQAVHFVAAINGNAANAHSTNAVGVGVGGLVLRCTAQIGDLYQEYKEIELGTPQKDPVPARVTLSSGTGLRNFIETYFYTSAAARRQSDSLNHYLVAWYLSVMMWALGRS
ncbi:uncharacterized protein LOC115621211 [Scaptodrosophila lebanonensis]|uniref:Uncharacterized protein LOC115621211 n=1 Tax=Drosophila lebanonensis TaxID=7225 RepID=A0A6J2T695_DROLE|nr:uncharacterized protein LOC115621211 [Scaptodrosophila lebanonensis]